MARRAHAAALLVAAGIACLSRAAAAGDPPTVTHPPVSTTGLCDKAQTYITKFLECNFNSLNQGAPGCDYVKKLTWDLDLKSAQNAALGEQLLNWTATPNGVAYACGTVNYVYVPLGTALGCNKVTSKLTVRFRLDFGKPCNRADLSGCQNLAYGCAGDVGISPPLDAEGCTFDGTDLSCPVAGVTHVWPLNCKGGPAGGCLRALRPISAYALLPAQHTLSLGINHIGSSTLPHTHTHTHTHITHNHTQALRP